MDRILNLPEHLNECVSRKKEASKLFLITDRIYLVEYLKHLLLVIGPGMVISMIFLKFRESF